MSNNITLLKKITIPAIKANEWKSIFGVCTTAYSLYDLLKEYQGILSPGLNTNNTLSGTGSTTDPLKISTQGAVAGQVLTFNGSTWAPQTVSATSQNLSYSSGVISLSNSVPTINISSFISSDSPNLITLGTDNQLKVALYKDATIAGNGLNGDPLKLAQQSATSGQVLTWNGTSWVPNSISGTIPSGSSSGQILYWTGSNWAPCSPKKDVQIQNTGSQVTLPFLPINLLPIDVYLNGVLKEQNVDYTISSNVITFNINFATNDKIITKYFT